MRGLLDGPGEDKAERIADAILAKVAGGVLLWFGVGLAALVAWMSYHLIARPQVRSLWIFIVVLGLLLLAIFCARLGWRVFLDRPNRYGSIFTPLGWRILAAGFAIIAVTSLSAPFVLSNANLVINVFALTVISSVGCGAFSYGCLRMARGLAPSASDPKLLQKWKGTWQRFGVAPTQAVIEGFDEIITRYSEPHRKYHTVQHLEECFQKFAEVHHLARYPAEVEVALWFHDAIYDARSDENESRSAELATRKVLQLGGSKESAERIAELIEATRHTAVPRGEDAQVLVDVDLSILAASPTRFDEYEGQVREEYSWMPASLFRRERTRILERFLARPAIFSTQVFRERYEALARKNIRRSIESL
jgi:predicted metal-dependent HD superfamily phosphohydrolase